jgi:hypothetical protein
MMMPVAQSEERRRWERIDPRLRALINRNPAVAAALTAYACNEGLTLELALVEAVVVMVEHQELLIEQLTRAQAGQPIIIQMSGEGR